MASIMLTAFSLASCFPKFDNTSEIIILTWCLRFLFFFVRLFFEHFTRTCDLSLKCGLTDFLRSPIFISSLVHQTSCLCHKILQHFFLYIPFCLGSSLELLHGEKNSVNKTRSVLIQRGIRFTTRAKRTPCACNTALLETSTRRSVLCVDRLGIV